MRSAAPGAGQLQAPAPPVARRQPIITLRMHEVAEELRQQRSSAPPAGSKLAPRHHEALVRCINFCRFFWTCAAGAFNSMAPETLSAAEAAVVALLYLLAIPNAVPTRSRHLQYRFAGSAEDVVALSLLRCVGVTLSHSLGAGLRFQRPYLLTAAAFAAVSLPLGLMKLAELRHSQWAHRQWPPFIALYVVHMAFAIAQVLAAQRISEWARRRWEQGLAGWGFPWEEGEDAWLLAGQLQSQAEGGELAVATAFCGGGSGEQDVPAEQLADSDSRWAQCAGLRVHYKLALPLGHHGAATPGPAALVLIHSFGGGAFSWRHVQQALADACGVAVLAFDRPGFGLTERPAVPPKAAPEHNPYSAKFQALLALHLADALGLRQVVLTGHGDGALLALMAAGMACHELALGSPLRCRSPRAGGGQDGERQTSSGSTAAPPMYTAAEAGNLLLPPLVAPREPAQAVPVHGGGVQQAQHARRGSFPDSLDWAWMSSLPEGHSVLQKLLRGEWPASIEPRASGGGSLLAGWAGGRSVNGRRSPPLSPLRLPHSNGGRSGELDARQQLLGPASERAPPHEHSQQAEHGAAGRSADGSGAWEHGGADRSSGSTSQQEGGGLLAQESSVIDNPSFLSSVSSAQPGWLSSIEEQQGRAGGLLAQESSLIENPSFLSQTSEREQYQRYSTQEAAVPLSRLEQGAGEEEQQQQQQQQQQQWQAGQAADEGELPGQVEGEREGGDLLLLDSPSFVAGSLDEQGEGAAAATAAAQAAAAAATAPAAAAAAGAAGPAVVHSWRQQGTATCPAGCAAAAGGVLLSPVEELAAEASGGSLGMEDSMWRAPQPAGLILLHPDLSGKMAPKYASVLAHSRLGRRVLRSLLRTETGEVTNRRAWADPDRHLTPELLELYRRPLRVQRWDQALIEVARARSDIHSLERTQLLAAVALAGLPVMVATGEHDHMVPPSAVARIAERLGAAAPRLAVLPRCGHLSHEEGPAVLLDFLQAFLSDLQAASCSS